MNEIKNYGYLDNLEISDYIAFPIYLIIILFVSYYIQAKNIKKNPIYKYYTWGVAAKLFGAIVFCLVYIYVYKGGDTIAYFETSRALTNLLIEKPNDFVTVVTQVPSVENYFLFDARTTGFPWAYMYYDTKTFLVAKVLVPFMVASFQSYMLATILFSWASFAGIWKLYIVFSNYYKEYYKQLAIAILFVPSAVFWGSGILKDTITLSASCWYIYSFYKVFIVKEKRLKNLIILLFTAYLILNIKSYIFIALLPGSIIWLFYERIVKIKSQLIRYSIIPFGFFMSLVIGYAFLSYAGEFDLNKLLNDASMKQSDLKRVEYKGNSFDIGTYDPTLQGAIAVSPAALIAGLYRPFVWEAKNIVMLLSGIENLIYLSLTALLFLKLKLRRILRIIFENPLLLFSISYSILLSLMIGLSTSNFGALVRFKIAFMPEFFSTLIILFYLMKRKKAKPGR
jgi:hypothetical protein